MADGTGFALSLPPFPWHTDRYMASEPSEKKASALLKLAFRTFINVGAVWFLAVYFPAYFLLEGGLQAIAIAGLTLTALNWLVVPLLHVLSLPIKFFAWIIAFLLVNAVALWLTVWFIGALGIEGVSLAVGGGIVGWALLSLFFGIANWLVRAIVK